MCILLKIFKGSCLQIHGKKIAEKQLSNGVDCCSGFMRAS